MRHAAIHGFAPATALCLGLAAATAGAIVGPHPATPPPARAWGELQPLDVGQIPPERDQSDFVEFETFYGNTQLFEDIDGSADRFVTANNWGMGLWTAAAGAPPTLVGSVGYANMPYKVVGESGKEPIQAVAVAGAPVHVAALAGLGGMGVVLVDVTNVPYVLYQDGGMGGKSGSEVAVVRLGEAAYALYAAQSALHAYDLVAAKSVIGALELAPDPNSQYPGIYLGEVHSAEFTVTALATLDDVVAVADVLGRVEFMRMDGPAPLVPLATLQLAGLPGAIGLWRDRGRTFFAALMSGQSPRLVLWRIDGWLAGGEVDAPLSDVAVPFLAVTPDTAGLDPVAADGIPAIYVASGREPQHEPASTMTPEDWLIDVRDPAAPRFVAAPAMGAPAYLGHVTQFGWARPRAARFVGRSLHRVAGGVYDAHAWDPPDEPPMIDETPPDTCVPGVPYAATIVAHDPEGALLEFSRTDGPAALTVDVSGHVDWACQVEDIGPHAVEARVFDGTRETALAWTITVLVEGNESTGDDGDTAAPTTGEEPGSTSDPGSSSGAGAPGDESGEAGCACKVRTDPPGWAFGIAIVGVSRRRRRR